MVHWGVAVFGWILAFYFGFLIAVLCSTVGRADNGSGAELSQYKEALDIVSVNSEFCPPEHENDTCNWSRENSINYNAELCLQCRRKWALAKAKGGMS